MNWKDSERQASLKDIGVERVKSRQMGDEKEAESHPNTAGTEHLESA